MAVKNNENFFSLESRSERYSYLRHIGFRLRDNKGNTENIVYRQDCTWRFHELVPHKLPPKFQLETYGVDGEGRQDKTYWIGFNGANKKPGLIEKPPGGNSDSYIFEIEREEQTNGGFALKVLNYKGESGETYYLPDLKAQPHVYTDVDPLVKGTDLPEEKRKQFEKEREQFVSLQSKSEPDKYLRHTGYILYNHSEENNKVYRQDCSWRFHEV